MRGARRDDRVLALAIEGGGLRGAISGGMCVALEAAGLIDAVDVIYGHVLRRPDRVLHRGGPGRPGGDELRGRGQSRVLESAALSDRSAGHEPRTSSSTTSSPSGSPMTSTGSPPALALGAGNQPRDRPGRGAPELQQRRRADVPLSTSAVRSPCSPARRSATTACRCATAASSSRCPMPRRSPGVPPTSSSCGHGPPRIARLRTAPYVPIVLARAVGPSLAELVRTRPTRYKRPS